MNIIPNKILKLDAREKLKESILSLVDKGFSLTEIGEHIDIHRNILTLITKKGSDYPISMRKIENINRSINEKFLNN